MLTVHGLRKKFDDLEVVRGVSFEVRARVGVVPQFDNLVPDFKVRENLAIFGRYFGLSRRIAMARWLVARRLR
ncbi:MAG: hypothetical protein AB7P31_12560 [Steroidobacteraceae bacterium]